MHDVLPFILCGGAGTRLWPLSREAFPKQFHKIAGPETLFQQTCRRLVGKPFGKPFILANHRHRFLIEEQLEEIGLDAQSIVLEPTGKNTAPAACIAALICERDRQGGAGAARAFRPHDRRRRRVCRGRRQGRAGGGSGRARHLRRRAGPPAYGLRLYRDRQDWGHRSRSQALRGEAGTSRRGSVFRQRTVLLEFRDLSVPRGNFA